MPGTQLFSKIAAETHRAHSADAPESETAAVKVEEAEAHFHQAFSQAAIALALADLEGHFLYANPALCALLGYTEAELRERNCFDITHPDDIVASRTWVHGSRSDAGRTDRFDKRYLHKSGREIWASISVSLVRDSTGKPLHFVAHIQDESDRRRAKLLENDRMDALEMVAQDKPLPVVLNRLVRLVERQMPRMWASVLLLQDGTIRQFASGVPRELAEAIGRRPVSFAARLTSEPSDNAFALLAADVETDVAWDGLRDDARRAGVECCWAVTVRGNDGGPLGLLIAFSRDRRPPSAAERGVLEIAMRLAMIGIEHHQTTRQLAHLVRHDALTGLPNRVLFEDRLHQALASARRNNKPLGLLALDLNRFKHVNDTLGHQAGDSLLQQFSMRLRSKLRESDTLARVGGDEFLVILPDVTSRHDAEVVARRLTAALALAPFEIGGQSLAVTSSIGIAMFPVDAEDTSPLQRAADAAMYRAKEEGRRSETPVSVVTSA